MIVRPAPADHYMWLLDRIGLQASPSFRAVEATDKDGRILGMVGYDGWTHNAVQLHIALDAPIALRRLIQAGFYYPFIQCGYGVALCAVAADNAASLRLVRKLGFREAYRVRDGHAQGVDLVLWEMRREDCRWIQGAK